MKSGAILALTLIAQPIMAQMFSNTTAPLVNGTRIANIVGWKYDGCEYDSGNFQGFQLAYNSSTNTVEQCTRSCSATRYAALLGAECYCGNTLAPTTVQYSDSLCNLRCPGDNSEACGGQLNVQKRSVNRRAIIATNVVISLYEQIIIPVNVVFQTVISTQFVNVCPTGLTTQALTQTLTLTGCGCTTTAAPSIAMVTLSTTCPCGPGGAASTVVVTVPQVVATPVATANVVTAAVVGTVTPVTTRPAVVVTNGGAAKQVGAGVAAIGMVAAAMAMF
jgi:hypothetical protein